MAEAVVADPVVLTMQRISKGFQGVAALKDVSLECRRGEVHALVGENGAGKSTLIKVLSGVYRPETGEMRLGGAPLTPRHPVDAREAGIAVIHQEFSLLPDRTVAQNIFLGREPVRHGIVDARAMREQSRAVLAAFSAGAHISPDTLVADLDVASRQMVEIAKAISLDARVVVMDEPTAALNEQECEFLFRTVEQLRARGTAVIYITHRMREVTRLADRVTVLKDGEVAARFEGCPEPEVMVRAMVGRDITDFYAPPAAPEEIGAVVLAARGLTTSRVRGASLTLRAGEIVGLAGVQGAGRTALALALYGVEPLMSGTIELDGEAVTLAAPRDAIRRGIGLLPGDRKAEALVLMQSVRDNGMLTARSFARLWGRDDRTPAIDAAGIDRLLDEMQVRAASYRQEIRTLSGGNQQKAVIARWLALRPRVLIFIEPTRGVDVNAKAAIYHLMREFARGGAALLIISSDLPEVIGVSDRILTMRAGTITGEFGRGAGEAEIMMAATLDAEEAPA